MEWTSIHSSSITAFMWDSEDRTLTVEFVNGHFYYYLNVPSVTYIELCEARNKVSYFKRHIENIYTQEYVGVAK